MPSNVTAVRPAKAGARQWAGLAVLALPTLLLALDQSVLFLAAPHLVESLRPTGFQLLWIMDMYGFMVAGFLVTMGTLGDRIGRRRLLLIGAVAVGAASVAAAYSTSAEMLIATRALLGMAAASLMPSTLALISNMFVNPRQRGRAIAVWASCFMAGTALGPVLGGALLQYFWWGSMFLLGVPVMALLLITAPFLLPEYRDPDRRSGADLVVSSAPPKKAGSAAAISEASGELGVSLGIAALGSLGTAVYRSDITVPAGVPADHAEAILDGIEGALVTAPHLPVDLAEQLLAAAHDAYTSGLNTIGVVCAALIAGTAALAATSLRTAGPANHPQNRPAEAAKNTSTPTRA